ncbi:MAG TPA: ABC transporter ATP-binding protein [Steroidobacteraceae bacterium]|nr:ABC transporter ATP-binding protein [Steroidobacteraceae bacterium]
MPRLSVQGLTKQFGAVRALDGVSFDVADGELVTLLGPSGCGKSTTLFAIAGLDRPTGGRILLGDRVLFDGEAGVAVAPEARNCGLVFQSYALWPHMTVRENVTFPLKIRGSRARAATVEVDKVLELVEMLPFAERHPHELSGGQQQRVALARTLVYQPALLLLDEPLSNLDAKLRERTRGWLKELQSRLRVTTIFVTHDQTEALSLSDRIIVLDGGRIMQIGTPQEIYRAPATPFIADFIGGTNFLAGTVTALADGQALVALPDGQMLSVTAATALAPGQQVTVSIRPQSVHLVRGVAADAVASAGRNANLLHGRIVQREFLGPCYQYSVSIADRLVRFETAEDLASNDATLAVQAESCTVFAFEVGP